MFLTFSITHTLPLFPEINKPALHAAYKPHGPSFCGDALNEAKLDDEIDARQAAK
jgi:hypothetical protein